MPIFDKFPLAAIREKQKSAIDFIARAYDKGYRDIVISLPTGGGKSAIGATVCNWAPDTLLGAKGGFYACTQKMLQNQMEAGLATYTSGLNNGVSIMSASSYECDVYGDCKSGRSVPAAVRRCNAGRCAYVKTKARFAAAVIGITNYPYLMTDMANSPNFAPRKVAFFDECHTIEGQILNFVNICVDDDSLTTLVPAIKMNPRIKTLKEFVQWCTDTYVPALKKRLAELVSDSEGDPKKARTAEEVASLLNRVTFLVTSFGEKKCRWVFFYSDSKTGSKIQLIKPVHAAPLAQSTLFAAASMRVYASAFAGKKDVFCRSLGLDEEKVAWASFSSSFPPKNRPVKCLSAGSMSRKNIDSSLPAVLKACERALDKHLTHKGVIHCGTYKVGKLIYDALSRTQHKSRLIFPEDAETRESAFSSHVQRADASVIISPSMMEGYDFADDLARFQIIAKVPFPYLGDKQIAEKKEEDPDWYTTVALMHIVQACGRGVRHDNDWCSTYIVDTDAETLIVQNARVLPKWFIAGLSPRIAEKINSRKKVNVARDQNKC